MQTPMPDHLGPYRLLERIGEGGMGVVHLARDPGGRALAIKVLRPEVAADPDARRRLGREFETMRRVRSPFVAEVIDADVTGDLPYVVTRYVAGPTLDQAVRQDGPLRGQQLERLAWGLAEGLAAVHDAGVVHRDLKPANVVMAAGVPVLIDFGIAQPPDATRITQAGMFMGTPGYLAPEVVEGRPSGPSADVHSWGSTVAFAATGRPPFGTGSYESIFYRIVSGKPDLDGIPAGLMPLVRAALDQEPGRRPAAASLSAECAALDLASGPAARPVFLPAAEAAAGNGAAGRPGMPGTPGGYHGTTVDPFPAMPGAAGHLAASAGPVTAVPGAAGAAASAGPALAPAAPPVRPVTRQLPAASGADSFADLLPPVPYAPPPAPLALPGRAAGAPARPDGAAAPQAGQAPAARPGPGSRMPRMLSLVTMVIAVAASLLLPVAGTIVSLAVIMLLRTAERAQTGLTRRRAGRGARASDALVAVLTAPWALLRATAATVLLAPLALTAAAAAAAVSLIAVHPLATAGAWAAAAFVAFYALGPGSGTPRRALAQIFGAVTRTRLAAGIAMAALTVLALGAVSAALSRPHTYWPASASLTWHWTSLRHLAATIQSRLQHL